MLDQEKLFKASTYVLCCIGFFIPIYEFKPGIGVVFVARSNCIITLLEYLGNCFAIIKIQGYNCLVWIFLTITANFVYYPTMNIILENHRRIAVCICKVLVKCNMPTTLLSSCLLGGRLLNSLKMKRKFRAFVRG